MDVYFFSFAVMEKYRIMTFFAHYMFRNESTLPKKETRILMTSSDRIFLNTPIFKKVFIIPVLFLFQFSFALKPTIHDIDKRLKEVYESNFTQSMSVDNALEIATECYRDSKSIGYENGVRRSGLYASLLYTNKKDYENSIKISNEIEDLMGKTADHRNLSEYYKNRALNYSYLGLFNESYKDYQKAVKAAEKIDDSDIRYYMVSALYLDIAGYYEKIPKQAKDSVLHYMVKALQAGERIKKNGSFAKTGERNEWVINLNYFLGSYYLENDPAKMILARNYFTKAKELYENSTTKMMLANEITFLSHLCKFYYMDHNYNAAVKYGLASLELQKRQSVPAARKIAYENIAKAYLQMGEQKEYQNYIDRYIALNDSIGRAEKNKTSATIEKIISKKDKDSIKKNSRVLYINIAITILILMLILLIWERRNKKMHSDYLSIIEKIKNEKALSEKVPIRITNSFQIPDETSQRILLKLEKFEKNLGFLKKDLTLSYLSNQFRTNPKTLSVVIKDCRDKAYNNYINGLKINYIIQKLYEDRFYREFKIDYLAEECGYSSSKVFVIAFKRETGVTPSYYIANLKKDQGVVKFER
jgi:AraC-like DNA-binding protein